MQRKIEAMARAPRAGPRFGSWCEMSRRPSSSPPSSFTSVLLLLLLLQLLLLLVERFRRAWSAI